MRHLLAQLCLCLLITMAQRLSAQSTVLSGTVIDAITSQPLPGAAVSLRSGTTGTTTRDNGAFSLTMPSADADTLVVSFLGYATQRLPLKDAMGTPVALTIVLTPEDTRLGEVVVTGTGTEHYTREAPVQTEVITAKAIRELAGRDIEEVLGSLMPSITYSRGDMGSNLKMNGLKNDYLLILIDGKRMNGDVGGQNDLSRINLSQVERIEVVKGAVSSLYGSDAIGGVINIITKKNTDRLLLSNTTRAGAYGDVDQANSVGLTHIQWNSTTDFNYKHTDGWQNTRQEWHRNKLYDNSVTKNVNRSSSYSVSQKLAYTANDHLTLTANAMYHEKWTSRPMGVPQWRLNGFYYQNQTYDLSAKYKTGRKNYLTVDGGYDRNDYFYDYTSREYTDYFDSEGNRVVYYEGDRILQSSQRRWSANLKGVFYTGKNHTLNTGAEYLADHLVSPYRLEGDQADAYSLSAYAQDEWKITGSLVLTAGLRVGHHKAFGQTLTPKLSAMVKRGNTTLRATYSNGFKAPTVKELYYHYYASFMSTYKAYYGNTELKPQTSHHFSVNLEQTMTHLKVSLTGYHNRIGQMIALQSVPTSYDDKLLLVEQTMKYVNMAKAYSSGVDATADADLPWRVKLSLGYSFLHARAQRTDDEAADNYLQYIRLNGTADHNATLKASWSRNWRTYKLGLTLTGRYQSTTHYDTDGDAKPFQTWRFNTSHQLNNTQRWNVDAQLGIDNLFDEVDRTPHGRNRASTSPGRTLYASVTIKFKNH